MSVIHLECRRSGHALNHDKTECTRCGERAMSGFRLLTRPVRIDPITPESQAINGLRMYGPLAELILRNNFGVDQATLDRLVRDGRIEAKKIKGVRFYRLKRRK